MIWIWSANTCKKSPITTQRAHTDLTSLQVNAQFQNGKLVAMNKTHKFTKLIPSLWEDAVVRVALNCKDIAEMLPGPEHIFLIKNVGMNLHFQHNFVGQAALLIKMDEVQYLCLLVPQVLWEMLSWPALWSTSQTQQRQQKWKYASLKCVYRGYTFMSFFLEHCQHKMFNY